MADNAEIASENAPETVANGEQVAEAPVDGATEAVEQEAAPAADWAEGSNPTETAVEQGGTEQGGTDDTAAEASQPKVDTKPVSYDDKDGLNKIFVGGITQETSDNDLRTYFSTFGNILDITIMKDRMTGKSRGFGFISFETAGIADKVVASKHEINGKLVEAKPAVPRGSQSNYGGRGPAPQDNSPKVNKIFVGGLSPEVSDTELKEYFSQFGTIVEATVVVDKETNRKRGFGFIQFSSSDAVDEILSKKEHSVKDKVVEVKKAFPKGTNPQGMMNRGGPPPMNRGMMGGGYPTPPPRGYGGNGYGNGHGYYPSHDGGYGQSGGYGYYGGYDQSKPAYQGYGSQPYAHAAPAYPEQPQAAYGHGDGSMYSAPQQPAYAGYDQSAYTGAYDASYSSSYGGAYGAGYSGYADPNAYAAPPAAGAARYHPYAR